MKANIGHLEAASGLAGIVKAVLMLENGTIPPNALFEELHPEIDADFLKIQVRSKYSLRCASRMPSAIAWMESDQMCVIGPYQEHPVARLRPAEDLGQLVWLRRHKFACHSRRCAALLAKL